MQQLTLAFDAGLTERFGSLKESVAAGVYQRGLKRMAADLDEAPGNLSVQLSGDGQRKFDLDQLETYMRITGDRTPIYYLIARFIPNQDADREMAMDKVANLLEGLPQLLASAGLATTQKKRRAA
ncbi:hypothetical protein [Niveibacterium terrae]|uniref:hypothetical protein n=1 Tax=Niveibacterium terrae TaxID=3373598 RepID=UPI003A90C099